MPNFDFLSVPYLGALIAYFFVSSIKMFDLRMTQAREGKFGPDMTLTAQIEPPLPKWLEYFYVIDWLLGIALLILNWKITLLVFVIRFILKVLPVLETVGNLLARPLRGSKPEGISDDELLAAYAVKVLRDTSTESPHWNTYYDRAILRIRDIATSKGVEARLESAIVFMNGDSEAVSDGRDMLLLAQADRDEV